MGSDAPREFVKTKRHDDFTICECPDDAEYLEPFLPLHSRFGAKALASMALKGSLPVGAVVRQFDNYYLYYDVPTKGLYALDDNKDLLGDEPALVPVYQGSKKSHNREARWVKYEYS